MSSLVTVEEARRFIIDCFKASKVPEDHAIAMADLIVAADYRGHLSHGMIRLERYLKDLTSNSTNGNAVPEIIKETPATAWVNGNNGLGAVVGNFCMDLAISKAKTVGIGWVCAKGSNHYGMAGFYSQRAMEHGLIGISMTNTTPTMAPTRSKVICLGTNPLALGAPAKNDKFLLDMATTTVALGKINILGLKGERIPNGWALDPEGNETNDPEIAFKAAFLTPLGGSEITSGYKGYGLSAMVEILCGIMAGADYLSNVRKWPSAAEGTIANLGQVFIAVNPNCFAPDFEERMADMNSLLRGCTPIDPSKAVLVAGDKEFANMAAVDKAGGIQYFENLLNACEELAKKLNVRPLSFV